MYYMMATFFTLLSRPLGNYEEYEAHGFQQCSSRAYSVNHSYSKAAAGDRAAREQYDGRSLDKASIIARQTAIAQ